MVNEYKDACEHHESFESNANMEHGSYLSKDGTSGLSQLQEPDKFHQPNNLVKSTQPCQSNHIIHITSAVFTTTHDLLKRENGQDVNRKPTESVILGYYPSIINQLKFFCVKST